MLKRKIGGVYEVSTTGSDPFLYTRSLPMGVDLAENHILAFDFFSLTGVGDIQVFLEPPTQERLSVRGEGLAKSEGWSSCKIDLKTALDKVTSPVTTLRIDFGRRAGLTLQIRNVVLRSRTGQERELAARVAAAREAELKLDREIRDYLDTEYDCQITRIEASETAIRVQGTVGKTAGQFFVAEIPLHEEITELTTYSTVHAIATEPNGEFDLSIDRLAGDQAGDHLLARWLIVGKSADGYRRLSHAHYIDRQQTRRDLPREIPHNRKGLGGFSPGRPLRDIEDLDISSVTVNIVLSHLLRTHAANGHSEREFAGKTWYVNDAAIANLDRSLLEASRRNLVVLAILLIPQGGNAEPGSFRRLIAHPDADPAGIYVMPNLTSAEGVEAYSAVLDLLAERYSRPNKPLGRIHHWIVHNEVNSGWVWTNMGEKTALRYMDVYHKSMRLTHLIARQYDSHSRSFISLEHNWTSTHNARCHPGRELLELLIDYSHAEGDFEWSLAYHPYPQDLRNPRTWEDRDAVFRFDTPLITFRNIEVIDAWMRQPRALYMGRQLRDIQFTEQAPNSPDYSEKSLREQAAALAYLWKKLERLDSISMFHVHNWVDNRHEGGLRIGLRRFPDDAEAPLGKKPIWHTYRALGTSAQEKVIAPLKETIGIQDWSEITYTESIR
jgi:hypothetical protein